MKKQMKLLKKSNIAFNGDYYKPINLMRENDNNLDK
jgi:hypothetical protein